MPDDPIVLTPAEQRVVGALLEKQITVPGSYPLSLNGLRTACNQTSSREPVTARAVLDDMEKRIWSDTWLVPDDVFTPTLGALRAWASERFDLDEVDQDEYHVGFHVYTV